MSNCFILGYFYLLKGIFYQHEMHICSDYLYQQKNAILNRMTNTDDVDSPNRLYNQLVGIEKHLGRDSDLQKEMDAFHHKKFEMPPWQRYESGYWVCNEFSELLGEQVKNFVPEIEIYQSG